MKTSRNDRSRFRAAAIAAMLMVAAGACGSDSTPIPTPIPTADRTSDAALAAGLAAAGYGTTVTLHEQSDGHACLSFADEADLLFTIADPTATLEDAQGVWDEVRAMATKALGDKGFEFGELQALMSNDATVPGAFLAGFRTQPGLEFPLATLRSALPGLQGDGWALDLIYVDGLMPNNGFHPFDDPHDSLAANADLAAANTSPTSGGAVSVAVIDTPMPNDGDFVAHPVTFNSDPKSATTNYWGIDGAGRKVVKQVSGHGPFIAQMIENEAPVSADTTLFAPRLIEFADPSLPPLVSDAELLGAIDRALTSTPSPAVLNLSLGRAQCRPEGAATEQSDGIAMYVGIANLIESHAVENLVIVAAAGNEGVDTPHLPAAYAMSGLFTVQNAATVHAAGVLAEPNITIKAVGSYTPGYAGDAIDCWSNYGAWVTDWAPGLNQAGVYFEEFGAALWSGTSFAAPHVTAAIANQLAGQQAPSSAPPILGAPPIRTC